MFILDKSSHNIASYGHRTGRKDKETDFASAAQPPKQQNRHPKTLSQHKNFVLGGGHIMGEKVEVLISKEDVEKRICEVARQINKDFGPDAQLHLVCVLKGGVFFMCELAKHLDMQVTMDFMSVSSYGDDTKSSGVVRIIKDLDEPLEGKEVLVVEDIIDSGRTLSYLLEVLKGRNPASIHLCTLLDKPDRRVVENVSVDYCCFEIPDEFVVGYGLDYAQKYRNLSYIGVVRLYGEEADA